MRNTLDFSIHKTLSLVYSNLFSIRELQSEVKRLKEEIEDLKNEIQGFQYDLKETNSDVEFVRNNCKWRA